MFYLIRAKPYTSQIWLAITNVKLQHPLAAGEHNAVIKISTSSLTDGKTMNGANVETVLVAK